MNETRSAQVVVGMSGSPASLQALRQAVTEARRRGATLAVVHAYRGGGSADAALMCALRESNAAAALPRLATWIDEALGGLPADLAVRQIVVCGGAPGPLLVDQAAVGTELLVIGGSRRRPGLLPGGGVAGYCGRHATCPVLVIPAPEMAREMRRRLGAGRRWERALEAELLAGVR
jgi:nucleotide-binding universal stress UspA family protein